MKTKILAAGFIITGLIIGCKKEVIEPTDGTKCNCGIITTDNEKDLSVTIKNSCSGNKKKFELEIDDWVNAHPDSVYCITNVNNW